MKKCGVDSEKISLGIAVLVKKLKEIVPILTKSILALVNLGYGILFLIFTGIIQTIDGYVVKPKLYGDSLGVSSLWILIAIICGGKMFGVVGVLLAIPFAAIVQYLLEEILFPKVKEERWKNYEDVKKD